MVLRKSFYIRWSAGRSPRVHEVNPGRDPSHSSSSAQLPFTPAFKHNQVMIAGCGIKPLLFPSWYHIIEFSITAPALSLYPFSMAYRIMASCSLTVHTCFVGTITKARK